VNLLATAGASSSFHGLAWAPTGPGAATPESPIVIALPVLGLVLFGGAFVLYRRRNRPSAGPLTIS
jgi:LPXTG-motif cell wall-anchored protein